MSHCKVINVYFLIILILVLLFIGTIVPKGNIYAQTIEEDYYNSVFKQAIKMILNDEDLRLFIDFERDILYDKDLNELGYIYEFCYNSKNGYAIIINNNLEIVATEIVPDGANPYQNCKGKKIYLDLFTYFDYSNGYYFFISDGSTYNITEIEEKFKKTYRGTGNNLVQSSERIYFDNKEQERHTMATITPQYYNRNSSLSNTCAPVAGANVIAFFDRYKTELIESYTPGMGLGSLYRYKTQNTEIDNLILDLYNSMGTNSTGEGNTISEFKDGLSSYCESKGYESTFTNCMSGDNLNYDYAKTHINNNRPVVMFVSQLKVSQIEEGDGVDKYDSYSGRVFHTMVGFGYSIVTYISDNGEEDVQKFLLVATGMVEMSFAYINIENGMIFDECFAVDII